MVLAASLMPNIPVGLFSTVMAILGAIVAIIEFKGLARVALASAFVLLGAGEIVMIVKADKAHIEEVKAQHEDVERLRDDLRRGETARQVDVAKLSTRLEDYAQLAQFAPAIMKLAETSAEYSKKQYETKVTSNMQLRAFTADVVKRMRDAEREHSLRQEAIRNKYQSQWHQGMTEAERSRLWSAETTEEAQESTNYDYSFRANILGDAIYARDELLKKLGPQPELPPMERANLIVFRGMLAGAYPVSGAATYLEQLAKKLSP